MCCFLSAVFLFSLNLLDYFKETSTNLKFRNRKEKGSNANLVGYFLAIVCSSFFFSLSKENVYYRGKRSSRAAQISSEDYEINMSVHASTINIAF